MTTYNTSDFRKGLKIQIDGVPYLMVEMNFRKPGKGNALYECKMKNLLRGTMLDRTYRAGQTLEDADVSEFDAQFLYRQQDTFVFMNNGQLRTVRIDQGAGRRCLEVPEGRHGVHPDGLQQHADHREPPNHVILKVEYAEPAARGNTATNVQKPVKVETGAEMQAPAFVNTGDYLRIDTRTGEYIERAKGPDG